MREDFYRAFEDRFRGSRELIKERLRAYLPFIQALPSLSADARAIDLGCGRGEWLELLKEEGFDGLGVDLDDGMLAACRERGLRVQTMDALAALRALPDESQLLVSGFHIVEHLPFDDVRALIAQALRVLKPAGLLVLETPNPENLLVGTSSFYLDPSHERPIPSELLAFAVEHAGFARHKVVRLQETSSPPPGTELGIHALLGGVSPDYGVVAQKAANAAMMATFDGAFAASYGVSLDTLALRYDAQDLARSQMLTSHEALMESIVQQAGRLAEHAEARAEHAEALAAHAEAAAADAQAQAHQAVEQTAAVLASRSWRITAPMRRAGDMLKQFQAWLNR